MRLRHTIVTAIALAVLAPFAAACNGDDPEAAPTTPSSAVTTTTEPSPSESAWAGKFSDAQMETYEKALQRYTDYQRRSEPVWRKGKVTPAAKSLLQEYFYNWRSELADLQLLDDNDVTMKGYPPVVWSRPKRVKQRAVTIEQCIDPTTDQSGLYDSNGDRLPGDVKHPYVKTIYMSKPTEKKPNGEAYGFLIERMDNAGNLERDELEDC